MLRLAKAKGFLLIEVLISVLVLSVGLIFIIRAFGYSQTALKKSSSYFKAINLSEEQEILSKIKSLTDEK